MADRVSGLVRALPDDGSPMLRILLTDGPTAWDSFTGTIGPDTITGTTGDDDIDGGTGADRMIGGLGNDTYHVDDAGDVAVERPGEGNDTVIASVSYSLVGQFIENLTLLCGADINGTGNGLDNLIVGNCGTNTLSGGAGNDTLDGRGGADLMIGGLGDDYFYVENAGDVVIEAGNEGYDTVYSSISYSLVGQYLEVLVLSGTDAVNGTGNSLANILIGNDGANTLSGGDGNDEIFGGGGIDVMIGGLGDDFFHVDDVGDLATERSSEGYDTVLASVSYTLSGQYIEALTLTGGAAINGTGNKLDNRLLGNDAANTLDGGQGNDDIDGGLGADTMIGGIGDDSFHVDQLGDTAVERNGEGYDKVFASISYSLAGQFIEDLELTGNAAVNATGNKLDNVLTGNSAANTLSGGLGNDALDGGGGADTMIGGEGDDTYYVGQIGDTVTEMANQGYDLVFASISYSIAGQYVEDLTLTGSDAVNGTGNSLWNFLIGNSAANTLDGKEGNDILDGGAGADTLIGGDGDDQFFVDDAGDVAVEAAGGGDDVVITTVSYSLAGQYVEGLVMFGTDDINGTGNGLDNLMLGNDGANILDGGAGFDAIDGGLGADTMIGGDGDDIFYVDDAGDVVVEAAGQGDDTVFSAVSYSLVGQYIENLFLDCGADIDGTGNGLDNLIVGNCGANTLRGGAGNDVIDGDLGIDVMIGGLGDDEFYVDDDGDLAVEAAGEGHDTVISSISYALTGQYIEDMFLSCGADIDGTGNSLANTLIGNCGSNVLSGMDGDDAIYGDDGADTLIGGAGADAFWFDTPDDGTYDLIVDFVGGVDTIHLDMAVFTGLAADGALDPDAFVLGTDALDADDRILYDSGTGEIWYDEDGDGAAAAVLFAQVTAGTVLTASDFIGFDSLAPNSGFAAMMGGEESGLPAGLWLGGSPAQVEFLL